MTDVIKNKNTTLVMYMWLVLPILAFIQFSQNQLQHHLLSLGVACLFTVLCSALWMKKSDSSLLIYGAMVTQFMVSMISFWEQPGYEIALYAMVPFLYAVLYQKTSATLLATVGSLVTFTVSYMWQPTYFQAQSYSQMTFPILYVLLGGAIWFVTSSTEKRVHVSFIEQQRAKKEEGEVKEELMKVKEKMKKVDHIKQSFDRAVQDVQENIQNHKTNAAALIESFGMYLEKTTSMQKNLKETETLVQEQMGNMKELTDKTNYAKEMLRRGKQNADGLTAQFQDAHRTFGETTQSMDMLGYKMKEMKSLLTMMNHMSAELKYISLSAEIEAKKERIDVDGFLSVTKELQDLVAQSNGYTTTMEQTLQEIDVLSEKVSSAIQVNQENVGQNETKWKEVYQSIERSSVAQEDLVSQIETFEKDMKKIEEISTHMKELMTTINEETSRRYLDAEHTKKEVSEKEKEIQLLSETFENETKQDMYEMHAN